jgi:hypothetical protein
LLYKLQDKSQQFGPKPFCNFIFFLPVWGKGTLLAPWEVGLAEVHTMVLRSLPKESSLLWLGLLSRLKYNFHFYGECGSKSYLLAGISDRNLRANGL